MKKMVIIWMLICVSFLQAAPTDYVITPDNSLNDHKTLMIGGFIVTVLLFSAYFYLLKYVKVKEEKSMFLDTSKKSVNNEQHRDKDSSQ